MCRCLNAVLALVILFAVPAHAQKVGSVRFTMPPGWTVKLDGGTASFTPAGGAAQGLMLLLPDQAVSGEAAAWFENTIRGLASDGTITEQSEPTDTQTGAGRLLTRGLSVKRPGGTQIRFYAALVSGKSATLSVLVVPDFAALKRWQPDLSSLLASTSGLASVAGLGTSNRDQPASVSSLGNKTALPDIKPQNAAQFQAAGGNPKTQPIPDEFRCYQSTSGDSFASELTVQLLPGGQYRTPYGSGSAVVKPDGSLIRLAWRGGPLDGSTGILRFDDYGQTFSLEEVGQAALGRSLYFECYQRGPRENLALLEFKIKTPAAARYACALQDGSGKSGGTLEILKGGQYRFGGQAGQFSTDFRSDQSQNWSNLEFIGGKLDGAKGTYAEDATGLRELGVSFPSLRCRHVTKPMPVVRYGTAKAPPAPKGSGGLSGAYVAWTPDPLAGFNVSYGCRGLCWFFAFFDKNGYVYTDEPDGGLGDADCSRTLPNGFPVCQVYRVQGGQLTIGQSKPQPFKRVGKALNIGGQMLESIAPLDGLKLNGTYGATSGFGGAGDVSVSLTQQGFVFTSQGQFVSSVSRSTSIADPSTPADSKNTVYTSAQSSNSGTYRFVGNTLELTYGDGHVERKFAFLDLGKDSKPDTTWLRIGGSSYTVADGK